MQAVINSTLEVVFTTYEKVHKSAQKSRCISRRVSYFTEQAIILEKKIESRKIILDKCNTSPSAKAACECV